MIKKYLQYFGVIFHYSITLSFLTDQHTCMCTNMCMSMYICTHMYEIFEKYLKGLKALKCHVSEVSLCIGSFPIFVTY